MGNKIANEADARSTAVELLERILLKGTNEPSEAKKDIT